ncbi:MAG TPA: tRNA (adenosine(37)-N6)-threonylcarbamoyltransferase complex dimerization subunit type 1 TsaB [Candidatus Cloacimonadota bacterium]|nr:tRNA (adenosine(37)-N6)-threonylcarbamoyltransferase complex dimerization subunit type 1 TsaB [Candidatus Cloacimonadota bacterium]HPT71715.1 tRNA (adenosine(37)-N6)-threonylcarbamoyltransferase complex dimerization subunit type 1 TsaB [Candidatus Cloacimonadota bacterium]
MNILAFDTSSPSGSIAISMDGIVKYASFFNISVTHSETLLPQIDSGLHMSGLQVTDINCIIATDGPGSFTGLRIGLATAKGLCMANQIPLITYSTLQLLASNCYGSALPILSMIDAKMHEIYYAVFTPDLEIMLEPRTESPINLLTTIQEPVMAVGSGFIQYGQDLIEKGLDLHPALSHQNLPMATGLFSLFEHFPKPLQYNFEEIANLEPMYLRKSQAEVAREKRLQSSTEV